jgi:protein-S-isoprenylcysteine O-methyltransferase Ste14
MLLAVTEMRRQRTTVIPHIEADHLVQSGVCKRSRNSIHLADVLLLAGFVFRWDAVAALQRVRVLFWVLEPRFVIPEERRLRLKFGADFHRYSEKMHRWL